MLFVFCERFECSAREFGCSLSRIRQKIDAHFQRSFMRGFMNTFQSSMAMHCQIFLDENPPGGGVLVRGLRPSVTLSMFFGEVMVLAAAGALVRGPLGSSACAFDRAPKHILRTLGSLVVLSCSGRPFC